MLGLFGKKLESESRDKIQNHLLQVSYFCVLLTCHKSVSAVNPLLSANFESKEENDRLIAAINDLPRMLPNLGTTPPDRKEQIVQAAVDLAIHPATYNDQQAPYYGVALSLVQFMVQIESLIRARPIYKGERKLWDQLDSTGKVLTGTFREITSGDMSVAAQLAPLYVGTYPDGYSSS